MREPAAASPETPFLEMRGISKSYGGVHALSDVDFVARRGEIHAVLGENGAGKSTLIKIASGVVTPDTGTLVVDGATRAFATPQEAVAAGVVCMFQELSLVPDLTVADNIYLTAPPRTRLGLIDRRAQRRRAEELLARVGCEDIDPATRIRDLALSRRQMVEIAKALGRDPTLLILDEATSALTAADVEKVYEILHKLRADGLALLYISHRMHEIEELADTLSVFRNGRRVDTFAKGAHSDDAIVQMMIGREWANVFPAKPVRSAPPEPVLEAENLTFAPTLHGVSLTVGKGEIVGIGGLDGQGQRELLLALFGVLASVGGTVKVDGKARRINSPADAKRPEVGMALIPEDRKTEGLMLPMSVGENITAASLGAVTKGVVIDRAAEADNIARMVKEMQIKVGDLAAPVATLSGGNQQKVVIAKWLLTHPRIILLNDPTRGIDVGTKEEIYALLRRLADEGAAVVLYTTDYAELIGCCDRVLVMYEGRVVSELAGDAITETNIVSAALNLKADAA
ncbi:sugar ABC transporter ATP-binding protein [Acuticoccus sp. I52.16.1]|uniref:sugar ABC transporter ATP-binding protein n=1 Tax=Acuticoccus sp. I52.16.1 TaxID=2928472 RepID=UPI001FD5CE18|nr:sugar ABC transporter ATP-binding protein [Acuticoccus sp. I52.16.1]UOM36906.1 sugar ABC transporter ATP-binding protein [Acuticoccus sp. I52.16.1]